MANATKARPEHSPIGTEHAVEEARRLQNPEYREIRERHEAAETCARELIRYRMEHRMTQAQLANLLGMPAPVVSRLERGDHVPSIDTLARVARGLGKRLDISFVDRDINA